ncbi:hypothetical protein FMUND_8200 [Fusarium mundagurra]|uniref:Uncharacterized protein n=2 Tax=Fusarium TaxID=5506 RepID=A0A8H5YK64_9HYPO|nr:hypothetical protein FMUND_8200 [Fusarium mundagurra]
MWLVHLKLHRYVALRLNSSKEYEYNDFNNFNEATACDCFKEPIHERGFQKNICEQATKSSGMFPKVLGRFMLTILQSQFYRTFTRPIAKTLLIAVFTYQLAYWTWVKLETDEIRAEREATIEKLETTIKDYDAATKANKA